MPVWGWILVCAGAVVAGALVGIGVFFGWEVYSQLKNWGQS